MYTVSSINKICVRSMLVTIIDHNDMSITLRITFLTEVYLPVKQNISWLFQSSVISIVRTNSREFSTQDLIRTWNSIGYEARY